jgi:hypothetical protein
MNVQLASALNTRYICLYVYVSVCASIPILLSVLFMVLHSNGSRDRLIVTTGWTAEVRFSTEEFGFSALYSVKTGSVVHPASYTVDTAKSFLRGKGVEADHPPPYSTEVENGRAISAFPRTS